jgi:hypothetical protein
MTPVGPPDRINWDAGRHWPPDGHRVERITMKWVKIHIPDREQSGIALVEMARRGRIDCYEGSIFVVPEPALHLLAELNITFRELDRFGRDHAEKMLRDTITAYEQRRAADRPATVRANSQ